MPTVTLFTSNSILTKKFWRDGRNQKGTQFSSGSFQVLDIQTHQALKGQIEQLTNYQALSYSTPLGFSSGRIVTQGTENEDEGIISRTKRYFNYPVNTGWLFIDCDQELTEQEVITRLVNCYPAFASVSYVYATSASHQIYGTDRFHLYFKVKDISSIKQATDTLFNRAFKQGYGFCKISESGSCLNRTFFDKAVFDPARLDYISGPFCVDFEPPERDIRVVQKEDDVLDFSPLLIEVDASEEIKAARELVLPQQIETRRTNAASGGLSVEEYNNLLDNDILHPGFKLLLADGEEVDVADIIKESLQAFISEEHLVDIPIQHPIEAGLIEKTKLYYNSERGLPIIHSYAHGGQNWELRDDGTVMASLDIPSNLLLQLQSTHGIPDFDNDIELFDRHPDTAQVLELMVETFSEEYNNPRVLTNQWGEMISLYLHLIDGRRGRYSIELPPSHGKTQVICHLILWLYKSKRVCPLSISIFRIKDIQDIKDWLLTRLDHIWREWETSERLSFSYTPEEYLKVRHSNERTSFEDLNNTPVIIHTHHVTSKNDYCNLFFSYRGATRHLFIFDEALYNSTKISIDLNQALEHLNYTSESGISGLPMGWIREFRSKVEQARNNLEENELLKNVHIVMPQLSEKYVKTGYYLNDAQAINLIQPLLNIGASDEPNFYVSRESGGKALFAFKENDIATLPRVVNTDATRSARRVHEYSNSIVKYPIAPYENDEPVTYWIAPFNETGRENVQSNPLLLVAISNLWLKQVRPEKVLVVCSNSIELDGLSIDTQDVNHLILQGLVSADLPANSAFLNATPSNMLLETGQEAETNRITFGHSNLTIINWGQHKQSNDWKECDAVIILNYLRKKKYNYKHDIFSEQGRISDLSTGQQQEVEYGFIIDEIIQAFGRGTMRLGKRQNCLMFSPYSIGTSSKLTEHLANNIRPSDHIELFSYPNVINAINPNYLTEEEQVQRATERQTRSDRLYANNEEKKWASSFRRACKNRGIVNGEDLQWQYLESKRNDSALKPKGWIDANTSSLELIVNG